MKGRGVWKKINVTMQHSRIISLINIIFREKNNEAYS